MSNPISLTITTDSDDKLALQIALDLHQVLRTTVPVGDVENVYATVYVETDAAHLEQLLEVVAATTAATNGLPHHRVSATAFHDSGSAASVHLLDPSGSWKHLRSAGRTAA